MSVSPDADAAASDRAPDESVAEDDDVATRLRGVEEWFVEIGVPHFVESEGEGVLDTPTRALPILVPAYLLLGLNALNLSGWTLEENLVAGAVVVFVLIATWVASNRLRGWSTFARPKDIDTPELALFVIGPALPVLMFGQLTDAITTVIQAGVLLILIYLWSSYGIGPLTRWAAKRTVKQFASLFSVVTRALPLLLLFNTFLFINAEVWDVAGSLTGPAYVIVIGTFFVLGATFAISRVPGFIRSVSRFDSWRDLDEALVDTPADALDADVDAGVDSTMEGSAGATRGSGRDPVPPVERLRPRERVNIGLVVLFGQGLQITIVVVALIAFFVGFGVLAITEPTQTRWMGLDTVHVLWEPVLAGRDLVLTEPLLRVAVFLGMFSGMYFTVVLTTDEAYRSEFSDDVGPTIRTALAARTVYLRVRREHGLEDERRRGLIPIPRRR